MRPCSWPLRPWYVVVQLRRGRLAECSTYSQVGAIAGGNAAVIKPSELAPTVSSLIAELLPKYLDNDLFHVVNGDIPVNTRALELKWDHSM